MTPRLTKSLNVFSSTIRAIFGCNFGCNLVAIYLFLTPNSDKFCQKTKRKKNPQTVAALRKKPCNHCSYRVFFLVEMGGVEPHVTSPNPLRRKAFRDFGCNFGCNFGCSPKKRHQIALRTRSECQSKRCPLRCFQAVFTIS